MKRGFASDNNSGIHPLVLEAITNSNAGHVVAYGDDSYTQSAKELFRQHFGRDIEVFFVTTGTAANVLGLFASTRSYNSIICARSAHLHVDECNAPQKITGCTLLQVDARYGKLTVPQIEPYVYGFGDKHHPQPKVISIAQPTEFETVYFMEELREIADFAHRNGMILHIDGARLSNAAVGLGVELRALTADIGVDVLSFGVTKNGAMIAESVVFFRPELATDFEYLQKQCMQMVSKMRFIAVQFEAILSNDLWRLNARQSNGMASLLAERITEEIGITPEYPVQTNSVFIRLPKAQITELLKKYFFYEWDADGLVRFMTSFDTTKDDVNQLVDDMKDICR